MLVSSCSSFRCLQIATSPRVSLFRVRPRSHNPHARYTSHYASVTCAKNEFVKSRVSILKSQQQRGKKTKASLTLDDSPQDFVPLDPLPNPEDEGPAYPTVVLQARSNMRKFENCVLVTRVGGFYELYFEHADEFGPLLNLKVAQKRTSAGPVSMVKKKKKNSPE